MDYFVITAVLAFIALILIAQFFFFPDFHTIKLMCKLPGHTSLIADAWELATTKPEEIMYYMVRKLEGFPLKKQWIVGIPVVYISGAEELEVVLSSVQHITKGLEYNMLMPWLRQGLLTSTGAKWHQRRKLLTPAFHFRILEECIPALHRHCDILVSKLRVKAKQNESVAINSYLALCTLDVICETAMGVQLQTQTGSASDYVRALDSMGSAIFHRVVSFWLYSDWIYSLTSTGKKGMKAMDILHGFTKSIIQQRKTEHKAGHVACKENGNGSRLRAFLDCLIELSDIYSGPLSDEDIQEEVDTFMFEGHETTSVALCWAVLLLGVNLDVQEQVHEELSEIFGTSNRNATKNDLNQMMVLDRVIKETLRLYPSVPYLSRLLEKDLIIKDYVIPASVNVAVMPFVVHRNKDVFPDPERFDPNRFLPNEVKGRHPFAYIPFSGGPRNCIGQKFAMMELKIVLSKLLRNFKIISETRREDVIIAPGPILHPATPIIIKLICKEVT